MNCQNPDSYSIVFNECYSVDENNYVVYDRSHKVVDYIKNNILPAIDMSQENFILLIFNTRGNLIAHRVLFKGSSNESIADPKLIFRDLILLNAYAFSVAHNHPSGNVAPSDHDIAMAKGLEKGGSLFSIKMFDSFIFNTEGKFRSMKEYGDY